MMKVASNDGRAAEINSASWLLCRAGRLLALPLESVVETMRLLPVEPLPGTPRFVAGLCVIRGKPVPVIDAELLFGGRDTRAGRLVTMMIGDRLVALAVQDVLGVRLIDADALSELPPLLEEAAGDAVQAIRTLDGELLLMLSGARLVPDSVLESLTSTEAGS
jgi:purine-binding chemotaxis protein CheW